MHFEGADATSPFLDEGGRVIAKVGNPTLISKPKFGSKSGYFNQTSLKILNPIVLKGDYTIECWINLDAMPATATNRAGIAGQLGGNGTTLQLAFLGSGHIGLWIPGVGSGSTWAAAGITTGKWIHIAAVRKGNLYYLLSEGILRYTSAPSAVTEMTVDLLMYYPDTSAATFNGYVDELYIDNSFAKYTGNYDVPTSPFTI